MSENTKINVALWIEFVQRVLANDVLTRDGDSTEYCDQVFESEMNDCIKATKENYNNLKYREAFYSGFTLLQKSFQKYEELSVEEVNRQLLTKFIEVQALLLAPLYPVISEYVWHLLGKVLTRDGDSTEYCDQVFESEMNDCIKTTKENYNNLKYREAFYSGFTLLQKSFQKYEELSVEEVNRQLLTKFIEVQAILLAPLYPVISEYVWHLLGKTTTIIYSEWPSTSRIDNLLTISSNFVIKTVERFQAERHQLMQSLKSRGQKLAIFNPTEAIIHVRNEYSDWQKLVIQILRQRWERREGNFTQWRNVALELKRHPTMKEHAKKILPFVTSLEEIACCEDTNLALSMTSPFDELMVFRKNTSYITHALKVNSVEIGLLGEAGNGINCEAGYPICKFTSALVEDCDTT